MRGGLPFQARRLLGTTAAGVFSTFFGLTLTLLLVAAAGFSAFRLEEGACYPRPGLTNGSAGYGRTEFSLLPLGVRCAQEECLVYLIREHKGRGAWRGTSTDRKIEPTRRMAHRRDATRTTELFTRLPRRGVPHTSG